MPTVNVTYSLRILLAVFATMLPALMYGNMPADTTQGMTVFGEIFIGKDASLSVMSDINLKADVKGEGTLQLNGGKHQTITSENAHVNNLLISNKANVALEGKLTVVQSFELKAGNLIVEKGSALVFENNCLQKINSASKIINLNKIQLSNNDWATSSNTQNTIAFSIGVFATNNFFTAGRILPHSPISKDNSYSFLAYQKLKRPPKN